MADKRRVSGTQRVETWNAAGREINRYKDDHFLWHKHVHNVELDAIQLLKCEDMDRHRLTVDYSSRRMGKTAVKEMYLLKEQATNADQELGIVAPREAQSMVNLGYHTDAIRRSPMLEAFVNVKQGRKQMADTYYQFANKSKTTAYGIMANVDGGDLTAASLEEVDDMPQDRLFSRFLLMLVGTRRLGASKESVNDPRIAITGVFKGADTLVQLLNDGEYKAIGALTGKPAADMIRRYIADGWITPGKVNPDEYKHPVPVGNAMIGMEMGLINREIIMAMRDQLGEDEFTRQLLCVNTSSRNLIWESWVQRAIQLGVKTNLEPEVPMPNMTYKKRGKVSLGYDHTGHGEKPESSKSALVITENLSGFAVPLFAKQWPMGTDESTIKWDIVSIWRYFMPDAAQGDAFGVGLIGEVNDILYREGLISIDRKAFETTASNWHEWAFAPIRFEGMVKHSMAVSLAGAFSGGRFVFPYVGDTDEFDETGVIEDKDPDKTVAATLRLLQRQLVNIKSMPTSKVYASYEMVKKDIGDDLFDALMAGYAALMGGGADVVTSILLGKTSREQLLGGSGLELPPRLGGTL